jgi:hypothetical protein
MITENGHGVQRRVGEGITYQKHLHECEDRAGPDIFMQQDGNIPPETGGNVLYYPVIGLQGSFL